MEEKKNRKPKNWLIKSLTIKNNTVTIYVHINPYEAALEVNTKHIFLYD